MSDTRLRDLERRWRETGAVDDEAAYLVERVRVGDLHPEHLKAIASLGYPAAILAAGMSDEREQRLSVFNLCGMLGLYSTARAVLSLIEHMRLELPAAPCPALVLQVRDAANEWLADPTEVRLSRVRTHAAECRQRSEQMFAAREDVRMAAIFRAASVIGLDMDDWSEGRGELDHFLMEHGNDFACLQGKRVREIWCAELVPWLLGYRKAGTS